MEGHTLSCPKRQGANSAAPSKGIQSGKPVHFLLPPRIINGEPLAMTTEITIPAGAATLAGALSLPERAHTLVLFVHGSGSSRHSPRNQFVARTLNNAGLATLLFDLLTSNEERIDSYTAEFRFNIELLAERLSHATKWTRAQANTQDLGIGYFGSSTGAAGALVAAAEFPDVAAIVSRGGRPDLAGDALPKVRAPTLLIVGGKDEVVITLNEQAQREMRAEVKLEVVPGATHLFEEPGALDGVAKLATDWFLRHGNAAKPAFTKGSARRSSFL